jgi:hypothetical protein
MRMKLVSMLPTALASMFETSMDVSEQSLGFIGFINYVIPYKVGFHGFGCWDEFVGRYWALGLFFFCGDFGRWGKGMC